MTELKITPPPPELVQQWYNQASKLNEPFITYIATRAAQWGADQELEACCEWLERWDTCEGERLASLLHEGRRPKPPSLKEQALAKTTAILDDPNRALLIEVRETLELNRRALEQLDD
jgi:hypothetical protein